MKKVLVTGANGQLANCIKEAANKVSEIEFQFVAKNTLDITNAAQVASFFEQNSFDFCINTAAYTNVEKAESDIENAFLVNAEGVKNISLACKMHNICLLHISTDYVFDGTKREPYIETDETNPINVYGASKLKGERYVQGLCDKYFIIRTSWLYSQFGQNFYKSILKLIQEKESISITTEQTGSPTNANDLAKFLIHIIKLPYTNYGVYHFSNLGETTWYGFAKAIVNYSGFFDKVTIVETDYYPTFAKRPKYSVLSKNKTLNKLNFPEKDWKVSLQSLLNF